MKLQWFILFRWIQFPVVQQQTRDVHRRETREKKAWLVDLRKKKDT